MTRNKEKETTSLLQATSSGDDSSLDAPFEQEQVDQFTRFRELANNSAGNNNYNSSNNAAMSSSLTTAGPRARPLHAGESARRTTSNNNSSNWNNSNDASASAMSAVRRRNSQQQQPPPQQQQQQQAVRARAAPRSRDGPRPAPAQNPPRCTTSSTGAQQQHNHQKHHVSEPRSRSAPRPRPRPQQQQQQQQQQHQTMPFRQQKQIRSRRRSISHSPVRDGGAGRIRARGLPREDLEDAAKARLLADKNRDHQHGGDSRSAIDASMEGERRSIPFQHQRHDHHNPNEDHHDERATHTSAYRHQVALGSNRSLATGSRSSGTRSSASSKSIKQKRLQRLNQRLEEREHEQEQEYRERQPPASTTDASRSTRSLMSYNVPMKAPNYGGSTSTSRPRHGDHASLGTDPGRVPAQANVDGSSSFQTAPFPGRQKKPTTAYLPGSLENLPGKGGGGKRNGGDSSHRSAVSTSSKSRMLSLTGRSQRVAPNDTTKAILEPPRDQTTRSSYAGENFDWSNHPDTEPMGCPSIPFSSLAKSKKKMKQMQHENDSLAKENVRLRSEINRIENRVTKMEAALASSVVGDKAKMREIEKVFQAQHSSLQDNNRLLASENEQLKKDVLSLEQSNDTLQSQLEKVEAQLRERKELSNVLEMELNAIFAENEENKELADAMQKERDKANLQVKNLLLDIEEHKHEAFQMSRKLDAQDRCEPTDSRKQGERIKALELELEQTLQSGMEIIRQLELELKEEREEVRRLRQSQGSANEPGRSGSSDKGNEDEDTDVNGRGLHELSMTTDSEADPIIYEDNNEVSQQSSTMDDDKVEPSQKSRRILKSLLDFDSGLDDRPALKEHIREKQSDDDGKGQEFMPHGEVSSEREGKRKSWVSEDPSVTSDDEEAHRLTVHRSSSTPESDDAINAAADVFVSDRAIRDDYEQMDEADAINSTQSHSTGTNHSVDVVKLEGSANTFVSDLGDSLRSGLNMSNRKDLVGHFGW